MLAFNLLCISFANYMSAWSKMPLISSPAISVKRLDAERFEQRFQLQEGYIFVFC